VFADRYHVRPVTSVREVRHLINYVLNNFRHHSLRGPSLFDGKIDAFSSSVWFPGWKERTTPLVQAPPGYDAPPHCLPQTWLLAEGWKRASQISCWEVPSPPKPKLG
jgi:hypothetical protein